VYPLVAPGEGRPDAGPHAVADLEGALVIDLSSRPPLASVLRRFGAVLLDALVPIIISIPGCVVAYAVVLSLPNLPSNTMQTVGIFIVLLTSVGLLSYSALILAMWAYGLTPGKWMLGIQVVKEDSGLTVGFWRMALRQTVGQFVSAIFCFLGYIWILLDDKRQGWHDKIASTLVVRTR
jgi:uncharacterized RDD family membrane protein YckC